MTNAVTMKQTANWRKSYCEICCRIERMCKQIVEKRKVSSQA